MRKLLARPIKVTEELKKAIESKIKARGLSCRKVSETLHWREDKLSQILRGNAKNLSLDEINALICYLPIHRNDLGEDFWYRYDSESSNQAILGWGAKRKIEKGESEDVEYANDEPFQVKLKDTCPKKESSESATLVKLLTWDLLNMLENRKDGDTETIRSYTDIIIRNLERIATNA